MRSGRCYLCYLALQTVRGAADSANKRDHDVTNNSMLHHNCALLTLFRGSVLALAFTDDSVKTLA